MSSQQYLSGDLFSYTNRAYEFCSEFCVVKFSSFQVLGEDPMDYGIRSGKSLILGIPKSPQVNIQGQPSNYAWGCPGRHPLFRLCSLATLLGAIFLFAT